MEIAELKYVLYVYIIFLFYRFLDQKQMKDIEKTEESLDDLFDDDMDCLDEHGITNQGRNCGGNKVNDIPKRDEKDLLDDYIFWDVKPLHDVRKLGGDKAPRKVVWTQHFET